VTSLKKLLAPPRTSIKKLIAPRSAEAHTDSDALVARALRKQAVTSEAVRKVAAEAPATGPTSPARYSEPGVTPSVVERLEHEATVADVAALHRGGGVRAMPTPGWKPSSGSR
jgi:hypothetical protein